jgi:hypothetical protein
MPADAGSPGRRKGVVEAEFQGGSIIALRLGGET